MKSPTLLSPNVPAFFLLAAIPLMLNVTYSETLAPNEEPKWGLWMLFILLMSVAQGLNLILRGQAPTPKTAPKISHCGLGLLLFWAGLALGVPESVNPDEALNRFAYWSLGVMTLIATARFQRGTPDFDAKFKIALVTGTLLLSLSFWKGFFFDFQSPEYNRFVQFSRIGHFNFTADALMVLIPLNAWIVFAQGDALIRGLALLGLLSLLIMLGMSGSLGGMGGLSFGFLITLPLWLRPFRLKKIRGGHALLALFALVTLVLGTPKLIDRMPQDLRAQMFSRAGWSESPRESSLQKEVPQPPLAVLWLDLAPLIGARTPMWASTAGMVAARPLTGFGTGSFLFIYPDFSKRYPDFRDFETLGVKVKTNPHNAWLQIAAENGLPLMLLFSLLYFGTLFKTARVSFKDKDPFWPLATWALLAAALDAGVNHVFFNPASLFMVALLLGLIHGRLVTKNGISIPIIKHFSHPVRALLEGALILLIVWHPLRYLLSEHEVYQARALEATRPKVSPLHISTAWESAAAWSPTNLQALFGLANTQLVQGQSTKAKKTLQRILEVAPFHSATLNLLASLEAREGRLNEAAALLRRAVSLEPDATTLKENLELIERSLTPSTPAS